MKIETIKDVEKFFKHLVVDLKVNFHPDDPFELYINMKTGEPTFMEEECKEFDEAMEQCFKVCEKCKEDIYGIGLCCIIAEHDPENL